MDLDVADILSPVFNTDIWFDEETPLAGGSAGNDPPFVGFDEFEQGCESHTADEIQIGDNLADFLPEVEPKHTDVTPLTGLDFSDSLTSATADVGIVPTLAQPWETGPMSQLFSKNAGLTALPKGLSAAASVGRLQPVGETDTTTAVAKSSRYKQPLVPSFLHVVCNVKDTDFLENRKASMKVAIDKFCKLILMNPLGFELGEHLDGGNPKTALENEVIDWLEAAFAMKAPNTVNKRANALLLYATFVHDYGTGKPFPVSAGEVVKYFQLLKSSGRYVSRATSLREALRFAHYTIGLKGSLAACDDVRAKGLAESMMLQGSEWNPADPLTVLEVRIFHAILEDESQPDLDRFAASCTLMMVYGRCRASDLNHIQKIIYDFSETGDGSGYVELQTRFHKTARRSGQRAKLLPIVAPSIGIDGKPWASKMRELRTKLGLNDDAENFPFWPAPLEIQDGVVKWSMRPLMSTEVSRWLRTALRIPEESNRNISSHSCKATCLSWLSKIGVGKEDRDILGRHVSSLQGAGPLYARDLLSSPLRKLDDTIDLIRRSLFLPDHTRSGMLVKEKVVADYDESHPLVKKARMDQREVIEVKDEVIENVEVEKYDSSETSEAESYSSSVDKVGERVDARDTVHVLDHEDNDEFFRHKRTKVVHIASVDCRIEETKVFNCGRCLNSNYMGIPWVSGPDLKCSSCFKGKRFVPEDQIP